MRKTVYLRKSKQWKDFLTHAMRPDFPKHTTTYNISHLHTCNNSQQNTGKLNPTIHKKYHI